MSTPPPLHLVPPTTPTLRLRPEERRRVPVTGRRIRVAVMARRGPDVLADDVLRRLAQVADVTFHRLAEAPDPASFARLVQGIDVLAATPDLLPVQDGSLLDVVPTLRRVVLLDATSRWAAAPTPLPDLAAAG